MSIAPDLGPTLVLAHRGDHRSLVENTLEALVAAVRVPGVDGVEFDVRSAADGQPVILHDETLARTFGVPLVAREHVAAGLARHGVPHLADALAALPADAFLDIELKDPPTSATIAEIASAHGRRPWDAFAVSSFDAATLVKLHAEVPHCRLWLNVVSFDDRAVADAVTLGCRGIAAHWQSLGPASVHRARAAGLGLTAWTVARQATRQRLQQIGLTAVVVEGAALIGGAGRV